MREVALDVVERVGGHVGPETFTRELRGLDVREHQLRLVVQHLLEVRDAPFPVHRIPVKSAAQVVAHPADRHGPQRRQHHRAGVWSVPLALSLSRGAGMFAQQEQQLARAWKLRRAAEPAMPRVEAGGKLAHRDIQHARSRHRARPRAAPEGLQPLDDGPGGLDDLLPLVAPDARNLLEHVRESRPAPLRRRRVIGAAVERLERRREPHAHRPPALPCRHLHECHVDAVDVRPLFAIHLDRHEVLVEQRGHAGVLEAFVFHDVAPVAGGIAD